MSNDQYYVDLEALDKVGQKLNGVLRAMSQTKGKSAHSTYLPTGSLGQGFDEETEIRSKHNVMKAFIEDEILKNLEELIDDLAKKTAKTRGAYEDREYDASNAMIPKVD
ncbi:hypothetical protein H3146_10275 [Streptomyces sp. OF3]|uniref:Uncharacterized protein n=1 Tax=Streptomyces alkaliterrae TaxID=2213162 RepID=A0A7W3ZMQ2_9ACTN|nr:hypothetical protein [Streptomyces alkaliterrae]MBB1253751.1 hypothetical protein [Streptomyces alkaliterrae]